MSFLQKLRLPYRDDTLFSILMFAVFVVPIAFTLNTYEHFETIKISLLLILVGWACIVFARRTARPDGYSFAVHIPATIAVVCLSVWILISAFHAPSILSGFVGFYPRFTSSAIFYILIGVFFLLLLATLTKDKFIFLLHILALDTALISIVGIMQSMGVAFYQGLDTVGFQRSPSLLGNPNFSSMFIVALIPVLLYFAVTLQKFWQKIYYSLVLFCVLVATVIFSSRGAWLGAVVCLVVSIAAYAVLKAPKKFLLASFMALVLGTGLWYVSLQDTRPGTITKTLNLSETNIDTRLYAWDIARQALLEHPILGTGPGNFQYFFQAHRGVNLADSPSIFDDVHNLFLQLGASLGIPFLLVVMVLLTVVSLRGLEQSWRKDDLLPATLVISLITFLIIACFTPVASACFVLLAVLIAGVILPRAQYRNVHIPRIGLWSTGISGGILIAVGLCFIVSEMLFFPAYTAYYAADYKTTYRFASIARRLDPANQLFSIYRTAAELQLGFPDATVESDTAQLIHLYPLDARGYLSSANILFSLSLKAHSSVFLNDAIEILKQAIALDPRNAARYSHVAFFYFALGKADLAMQYVEYSIKLNENNVPGWMLLARIHQIQGHIQASKNAIAHAYKLEPQNEFVRKLYEQSRSATETNFPKISIPVFFNPNQIE
jgi:O-antigen ligase